MRAVYLQIKIFNFLLNKVANDKGMSLKHFNDYLFFLENNVTLKTKVICNFKTGICNSMQTEKKEQIVECE